MKKTILTLAAACAFFCAPLVSGTILSYDFVVDGMGKWGGTDPRPFGLPLQPGPLRGTLTVDNTKTDILALIDFFFVTGTKTWTEDLRGGDLPVPTSFKFDASGNLTEFFINLEDPLLLSSNNTMSASDGGLFLVCTPCVNFPAPAASAPGPGTLVLLLGAFVAAGGFARRRNSL